MKDSFSIRITFCEETEDFAKEFIEFIETNVQGLNIKKPAFGNNPRYQEGGDKFNEEQGLFKLAYSRLNVKNKKFVMPKILKK